MTEIDHDENLRLSGIRRGYAERRYRAATAALKLAVIMAFRAGMPKQRIARRAMISVGTVSHWLKGVEQGSEPSVPGDVE